MYYISLLKSYTFDGKFLENEKKNYVLKYLTIFSRNELKRPFLLSFLFFRASFLFCVSLNSFLLRVILNNRNTLTDEGIELVLTVMEAKELIGPADAEQFDTFVRIYMVPDETVAAQQTKVCSHQFPIHFHISFVVFIVWFEMRQFVANDTMN